MSLDPLELTFLAILATGTLVWLILRTYESERAKRARFIVAIIIGLVVYGLLWPQLARNSYFNYVLMGFLAPLFRLWPLAIIVLLWLIWKELRRRPL
jgi:hypothetical protein